jgi:hypothetical protein
MTDQVRRTAEAAGDTESTRARMQTTIIMLLIIDCSRLGRVGVHTGKCAPGIAQAVLAQHLPQEVDSGELYLCSHRKTDGRNQGL